MEFACVLRLPLNTHHIAAYKDALHSIFSQGPAKKLCDTELSSKFPNEDCRFWFSSNQTNVINPFGICVAECFSAHRHQPHQNDHFISSYTWFCFAFTYTLNIFWKDQHLTVWLSKSQPTCTCDCSKGLCKLSAFQSSGLDICLRASEALSKNN